MIEYLGHSFKEINEGVNALYHYECTECFLQVNIDYNSKRIYVWSVLPSGFHSTKQSLKLTCNEVIIKNLLE